MLNVADCRVSTEEQAAEGFSIDGQAEKLSTYAQLHDLGPVTVIQDPGRSGKDLDRPGLQQVLAMVEQGHVANVLVWRLDRLSRNLGDLILLAEALGKHAVGLHSLTEKLDLSSATGRMFYNILGAFAQFYREQLAENVRLGMHQAARQGKWTNRPKFGYDLVDGELVPNADAPTVRRIFELRARGLSYPRIEELTGVKYSTARTVACSHIYLGEVLLNGQWYPGNHEPLVTAKEFEAAHRGEVPWQRRSRHVLAGRVRCGLCGRVATIRYGREGRPLYRCRHRGDGCSQPSRSAVGLVRAVLLGLRLVADDQDLQEAIRRELKKAIGPREERRQVGGRGLKLDHLIERRRKLLELYYADRLSAELFAEQEARLSTQIEAVRREREEREAEHARLSDVAARFEEVARILREMDVGRLWEEATDDERRVLVEELLDAVAMYPDHLEVTVKGAPRLNVTLKEAGLGPGGWQFCGVGGGI
jgi:site-specific DNA recombinase